VSPIIGGRVAVPEKLASSSILDDPYTIIPQSGVTITVKDQCDYLQK